MILGYYLYPKSYSRRRFGLWRTMVPGVLWVPNHRPIWGPKNGPHKNLVPRSADSTMHVVIFWPREYKNSYRTSTGVDSVDVRWCMLWFSGQENTKTAIAHRLASTRSMCDDACCDFLAKRIQKQPSHIDWRRLGRSAMMHVVIFWPREYKNSYRTPTGLDSADVRWCMLWFSGQENTETAIAHRLVSTRSMCDDACCDLSGQ